MPKKRVLLIGIEGATLRSYAHGLVKGNFHFEPSYIE
jgi:hypothetical protein